MEQNTGTADAITKNHNFDDNTTTTTKIKNPIFTPQKYRGHTLEILGALSECGGMIAPEISSKTFLSKKIINVYCNRCYKSGILIKVGQWGWALSPLGIQVLALNLTTTTSTDNTKTTQRQHKDNTKATQKNQQLNISDFFKRQDLTEAGRLVVVVLVDHYERTGEKYRIFQDEYDVAKQINISLAEVRPALAMLKEEGCIYFMKVALGWKIGLKVAFVERLQYA